MEGQERIRLRAHHLLCMLQFDGFGYSDGFSVGMGSVIDNIRLNPGRELIILDSPDVICANCPNLRQDETCDLSEADVLGKDRAVIGVLGLEDRDRGYSYERLHRLLLENMDRKRYEDICSDCRWYEKGLCGYDKLRSRLSQRMTEIGGN